MRFSGIVEVFPGPGGWHYVDVPARIVEAVTSVSVRGLIPVRARMGGTEWDTSLQPRGDGRHFLALKRSVRAAESVEVGDTVTITVAER
ncbi:DUF1905 domain-containing protein [Rhodococcus aetherivorans]|uniref:DUF1905 domain-containing protein n=1 Tax=Rhodococcus aetherivorans TaxID=191292 RepID=A0ABQ0YJ01_9NOCA|nr:DUF1905 domain-containing protein [Rhodococcus aetherivorans]ETT28822.1 protein of unknown function DUF1905 [Rhodococcus rhodochrous ATCC 21198]KDE10124.1 hypothetical protein N505_0126870 [Rhodococcus aetherivorans]NGP29672.1 DUF1905 domain-containing protein [Rhodococcus aetherivorans]GES36464.1 hypothetical protein RAJCM14343_1715 [Rhodococcus aetherivorans]